MKIPKRLLKKAVKQTHKKMADKCRKWGDEELANKFENLKTKITRL